MIVTIYHNPRCSKSLETLRLIEEKGIKPNIIEYLKQPPTIKELRQLLLKLGVAAPALARKKDAADKGVELKKLTDNEILKSISQYPSILQRPIIVVGEKAVLGRPPENVLSIL